jgi:phage head maturation protease
MVFGLAICVWTALYFISKPAVEQKVQPVLHYVRIAATYEGNIDFRFYITTQMLKSMVPQMIGKPMLLGHDWANPNVCVGRIVDASVQQDKFGHYLEIIVLLNNDEAADMIKRTAYHSVSIGFMRLKAICMIDNLTECNHEPGHQYMVNGHLVLARFILQEVDMCEVSFVNVPASRHARVLELANHPLTSSTSK